MEIGTSTVTGFRLLFGLSRRGWISLLSSPLKWTMIKFNLSATRRAGNPAVRRARILWLVGDPHALNVLRSMMQKNYGSARISLAQGERIRLDCSSERRDRGARISLAQDKRFRWDPREKRRGAWISLARGERFRLDCSSGREDRGARISLAQDERFRLIALAGKDEEALRARGSRRLDCSSAGRLSYLRVAKRGRSRRASCGGLPGSDERCIRGELPRTNESCAVDRLPYIADRLAHAQNYQCCQSAPSCGAGNISP
ncbi:hypothetical protein J6590_058485 [Homalodisca vitripennis]|nr:hypothetical protein J6590_058485 [Homalodisca vitripennis]